MPKPIKKRLVKKPSGEIEVKSALSHLKESVRNRKRVFAGGAAAVIISAALIAGFFVYNATLKNKAEKLGYEAYKIYYGIYQKQPSAKEERYKKALELFKQAYGAKKSPVPLYYIASCYYETERYDDALNALKELNQRFPDDERLVPLSYYKMAMVHLKKGSSEDALKSLDVLYNYKTGTYKDLALIESGKILEALGRAEEAKKKYEELTKSFPQSLFAEEAQARLGEKKKT